MKFPIKRNSSTVKTPALFLDKESPRVIIDGKIDIVLSPSLYWFREEVLPVKSAAQAKKLTPSLFDAVIPEGVYGYHAQQNEDAFWLFAFDEALIAKTISEVGLRPNQIQNVYFAQNECDDLKTPLQVSEKQVLINHEGVVSLIPKRYTTDSIEAKYFFDEHPRSKYKVTVNLFKNNFIDEKQLNRLLALAVAFVVIYLGAFLLEQQRLKQVLIKQYALVEHYNLPQTSFELKGLKKSLESKQKRQMALRTFLKTMFKLPLKKDEFVQSVEISSKKVSFEIMMNNPKRAEVFKVFLQKSIIIKSAKVKKNIFYVSGSHE